LKDRIEDENPYVSPLQTAANYFEKAVMIAREIGDYRLEGRHVGNWGSVISKQGDTDRALMYYKQALAISEEIGDRHNQVRQLENMRSVYISLDNKNEAHRIEARLKEISNKGEAP